MEHARILDILQGYVAREILDGRDAGLDGSTPLLEWGLINSIEMARLLSFIEQQFQTAIPMADVQVEHFQDLTSVTNLIVKYLDAPMQGA